MQNTQGNTREPGQSLVEFSIALVILLVLLAGAVDLGRWIYTWIQFRDAAEEGVVFGAFAPENQLGIIDRAQQASTNPVDLVNDAVILTDVIDHPPYDTGPDLDGACAGQNGENIIWVEVAYKMPITMPFLGTILDRQSLTVRAREEATILRPPCP